MASPRLQYCEQLLRVALVLVLYGASFVGAIEAEAAVRRARAVLTDVPPVIDGITNDAVWERAPVIDSFAQYRPEYGKKPTERTEVRILYDHSYLYVAFDNYVSDPNQIIAVTTRRDGMFFSDDNVGFYLDTFYDRRNAYGFFTNPLGTQRDLRVVNEGLGRSNRRGGDTSWDCTWRVKTARLKDRWSAEFAIPFAELRFDAHGDVWGINFMRNIEVREEQLTWADIGNREYNISRFGTLTGLDMMKLDRGQNLFLTPYSTFSPRQRTGAAFRLNPKFGVDLRYPLAGLTADVTLNPDFAQIEADPARVNLTDIEFRLPEKRPFFLEGGDLYRTPIEVFYTRRIENLDFGAKIAGRFGDQNIALVSAQARPFDQHDALLQGTSNFTAARYQRDVSRALAVGVLAVNKYTPRIGKVNGAAGADMTLRLPHDVNVIGNAVGSWLREETDGADWTTDGAYVINAGRRGKALRTSFTYFSVGPDFKSEAGFIPRTDRRGYIAEFGFSRQYEGVVNRLESRVEYERLTDFTGRMTNERIEWNSNIGIRDFFLFMGPRRYFHINTDTGEAFQDETVELFLGWFPPKYAQVRLFQSFGYRNGERSLFFSPFFVIRPTEAWRISYSQQHEMRRKTSAEPWRLTQRVQRVEMRYQFTQRSFLSGSAEKTRNDQMRFFILYGTEYRPKSFLFLVYNEQRLREKGERIVDRALFLKFSYQTKVW